MAKTLVIDSSERTRVPFLRGILTRSLQEAGLAFDNAYRLADTIRQELDTVPVVSTRELQSRVAQHLAEEYGPAIMERYQASSRSPATILVRSETGEMVPFSRNRHSRCLISCSLSAEESNTVTNRIYEHLLDKGVKEVTARHLGHLTYRCLHSDKRLGPAVAQRYLVWVDFQRGGRPLIVLIGGAPGCGKSTVATELANQLEIVRTQSTDMLREVMRMMIPQRLLPVLHTSSFAAASALPSHQGDSSDDPDTLVARGYQAQAELLWVALEAVVHRALRERVSLILEGVHVGPAFIDRLPGDTDAVIVPIMLGVLKRENLRNRFRGRGAEVPGRRSERYLAHFDAIWSLQSFLLSEADRAGIPIINNNDKETVLREIMRIIIGTLAAEFASTPRKVFQ
jgi:2-phosphoglycerate kinase